MTAADNKDLVRRLTKDFNSVKGDASKVSALFEKYYLPDYIHHDPSRGDMKGQQRMQYIAAMIAAFPDMSFSEDGMVAEGDMVASRYTMRVTHTGTFMGIPPTGKQIVVKGADVRRIEGGKVAEIWDFIDTLGILTQMGATPNRPTPK